MPGNFAPCASSPQSVNAEDVKQLPIVQGSIRRNTGMSTRINAKRTKFLRTTKLEGIVNHLNKRSDVVETLKVLCWKVYSTHLNSIST
jgi:hypothetical protein